MYTNLKEATAATTNKVLHFHMCSIIILVLMFTLISCGRVESETQQFTPRATAIIPTDSSYPAPLATSVAYPIEPIQESPVTQIEDVLLPPNVLGVVVDKDFIVLHIEPNSAADVSRILVNDALISLNGLFFGKQTREIKQLIFDAPDNQIFRIVVLRDGTEITLDIVPTRQQPQKPVPTFVVPPDDYF